MQTTRSDGPGSERDQARFYSKVALPDRQGCMLWLDAAKDGRYGGFWLNGRTIRAHRYAYTLAYGPIPDGLVIDHVRASGCVSTLCVAPLHLEAVTHAENIRRGETGARLAAKTHCPQGHPYSGDNLYIRPGGGRVCRECKNASWRALYDRRKGCKPSPAA